MPSLFDLAPGGVCRAAAVTSGAVRFTAPFLPYLAEAKAVSFLWHFP